MTVSSGSMSEWRVWRIDGNGNRFLVRERLNEPAARDLVRHFETLGHKQHYWAEAAPVPGTPDAHPAIPSESPAVPHDEFPTRAEPTQNAGADADDTAHRSSGPHPIAAGTTIPTSPRNGDPERARRRKASPSRPSQAPRYWFPAKRFGWGWGPPSSPEGWIVLAGFILLALAGIVWFDPRQEWRELLAYFIALQALLLLVCFWKGEPPRWRWGDKE